MVQISVPSVLFTAAAAVFVSAFFYFRTQLQQVRDTYPRRTKELRDWNWSDVSEELRELMREINQHVFDNLDPDEPLGQDEYQQAISETISADFGPENLEEIISGVEATREPTRLYEKLKRRYLGMQIFSSVLFVISVAGAVNFSFNPPRFSVSMSIISVFYGYPVLTWVLFCARTMRDRDRLGELWEDYRGLPNR